MNPVARDPRARAVADHIEPHAAPSANRQSLGKCGWQDIHWYQRVLNEAKPAHKQSGDAEVPLSAKKQFTQTAPRPKPVAILDASLMASSWAGVI
jgi:hypothetical protein